MKDITVSVGTIAKLLDKTERRVQQLVIEGIIPRHSRGCYALVPAVNGYLKYLRDGAIPSGEDGNQKRRLLKARADIAEMKAERLDAEHVPVGEVEKAWTEVLVRYGQRTMEIAPRAAPLLVGETSIIDCRRIIEELVHEALAELASIPMEAAPGGPDGDDRSSKQVVPPWTPSRAGRRL